MFPSSAALALRIRVSNRPLPGYKPCMFKGWEEFYLMAGSAAAVLIGLIFVVVTLMHDRPRSSVLAGSKLYMGPVLLQVSFVLVLSASALAGDPSSGAMALISGGVAVWGLGRSVLSILGIRALRGADTAAWDDVWFYGAIPAALYLALGVVAFGFWSASDWAIYGFATMIVASLLSCIRNEWDLVTWLAPRPDGPVDEPPSFDR
jgi:hypothetical protein